MRFEIILMEIKDPDLAAPRKLVSRSQILDLSYGWPIRDFRFQILWLWTGLGIWDNLIRFQDYPGILGPVRSGIRDDPIPKTDKSTPWSSFGKQRVRRSYQT